MSGAINTSDAACEFVESVEIVAPAAGTGVADIVGSGEAEGDATGAVLGLAPGLA
ncbi:MAG: hypothetical protein NVS2B17_06930 [Candidatus Velthaea sp.]